MDFHRSDFAPDHSQRHDGDNYCPPEIEVKDQKFERPENTKRNNYRIEIKIEIITWR